MKKGLVKTVLSGLVTDDHENCVMSFIRKGKNLKDNIIVVCNLTPAIRKKYKVGIPVKGKLVEVFNSDSKEFGGSGISNKKEVTIKKQSWQWKRFFCRNNLSAVGYNAISD